MALKVLLSHNRYQQPGGEDEVFRTEGDLLRARGHRVVEYIRDNNEIVLNGIGSRARLARTTIWSKDSYRALREVLRRETPDVAHFHNTFPLISPAAYYACREEGVAVVQSLHNPRLLCPAATLYRNGEVCQDCLGWTVPWPGVLHGCYRNSRAQTAVVSAMLALHRLRGTWCELVDRYVVFTEFYRQKLMAGGLPAERIAVKPHFVHPNPVTRERAGDYALFVGRLAAEKGIPTLLAAWRELQHIPLKIRGEGPLSAGVEGFAREHNALIECVPRMTKSHLADLMKGARFLVWPSLGYYETFGLVAIEAFACGVPVIASRLGAMQEIVADGRTGLHFTAGDADDLAAKVEWAWSHPQEMEEMGRAARKEYEQKYTAERNYRMLMDIYQQTIARRSSGVVQEDVQYTHV